jgi:hypothetical protein
MCMTDDHPTCYDLSPVRDDLSPVLSITEMEIAALRCVDLAEQVVEPLNRFTLCKLVVRAVGNTARLIRAKRSSTGANT